MNTQRIKFTSAALAILFLTAAFVCLTSVTVSAQTLEAGDIIYSRLPVAPSPSGTIWAIRQDGTNNRQIAAGSQPRLSPNNRYLLFRRNQFPTEPDRFGQLFVRDLTTNSETLLLSYNDFVVGYDFTPDSSQIIFDGGESSGISKIDLDGTNRTFFGGSSVFDDFPVVRRGDGLVAHHRGDGTPTGGIYTLAANGSIQQLVPNTLGGVYPSWSPDGQFIAFTDFSSTGTYPFYDNNLFKIKPDGSGRVQLTNLATSNNFGSGFVWTTNGTKLIVPANINGTAGIYLINTDGSGAPALVANTAGAAAAPDFVGGIVPGQAGGGSGNYQLLQAVMAGGGGTSANANYSLTSTMGEAVAGVSSSGGSLNLQSGFWGGGNSSTVSSNRTLFDYDGDGKADVSVFRPSSGVWYLQNSSGGVPSSPFGVAGDKIVPADYDGDGKTDLAVFRPSSGVWYILKSAGGVTILQFGISEDLPAPADYDGDGRADIALFRPSSGVWYINGSSSGIRTLAFGQSGDVPVAADYDGDGRAEVAVYRPSSGVWYEQRSSGGFYAAHFGISTDLPAKADYDGDGRADIAVFRPATGIWYLLQSTSGFTAVQFGQAGDRPSAADYDGDGRADVAVFRPATGIWYEQRSRGGVTALQFGQSGDVPTEAAFVP